MSAFVLEDGAAITLITPTRAVSTDSGAVPGLDRAPLGRNETGVWWPVHDEYDKRVNH